MEWKVKLLASALSVLVAATIISGGALADDNLLKTIKDRGVMRVCEVEYQPWNVHNPVTNKWEGISVDVADEIAKPLGVTVEHVDATWPTLIPSLDTHKCDFSVAGMYVSPARAELVTFTQPYAQDGIALFVPTDSQAKSVSDLDQPGKVIVTRAGALEDTIAKQVFKKATVKSLTGDRSGVAVLELAAGRADAAAGGYYGNILFLKQNPNLKVKLMSDVFLTRTPLAYVLPAKEYFFRDYVNSVIVTLEANGKMKELIDKWTH